MMHKVHLIYQCIFPWQSLLTDLTHDFLEMYKWVWLGHVNGSVVVINKSAIFSSD